ncbi:MAG TPA: hypothetical protein VK957_17100 [Lunatimonas sp.]|nr:hypothetical protein [Lunatimonas sp.]
MPSEPHLNEDPISSSAVDPLRAGQVAAQNGNAEETATGKSKKKNWLVASLRNKSERYRISVLITLIVIGIASTILLAYYCYFVWLPAIWNWGFAPISWWRAIFAVIGAIYLILGPFLPYIALEGTLSGIGGLYSEEASNKFEAQIHEIEVKQSGYEEILKEKDTEGLIPLVTYSRLELEQYYKIGLSQSQRSFQFSMIAMWLGFLIIAFGIVSYIVPASFINRDLVEGNFQILTISSGIVMEVIAALFLGIYRNSMNRSTYFYNRQVFIHNALLAYKIANSMKEPDLSKQLIIEKILEFGISANPTESKRKSSDNGD